MISLQHLRLRVTLWFAGSFALLLLLLGAGLFVVLTRERSQELQRSLELLCREAIRSARIRISDGASPEHALMLAAEELDGPEWTLFLLDDQGHALFPSRAGPPDIGRAAATALREGTFAGRFTTAGGRWRLHAERTDIEGVPTHVFVAVANEAPIERHYARLLELFLLFGLASLLPIAFGGSYLARISSAPALNRLQQFTADAAHELRNPVAVLRGRSEVALERERAPEEYVAALRDVVAEAQRLSTIVDDLLLLVRADAGERPPPRELVYLDDIASDAVHGAAVLARSHGVQLSLGSFEEAQVRGDPVLLRRLLMILLDNAIKFTPAGRSVRLDVHVADHAPTVVVEDQGIGIEPADQPRIFDRFFRADPARRRAEGSGLGLAIARYIADLHGAHITVDSEPGRGSRFTVAFPKP